MIEDLLNEKELELFSRIAPEISSPNFTIDMLYSKLRNQQNDEARRAIMLCIDLISLRTGINKFSPYKIFEKSISNSIEHSQATNDLNKYEDLTRKIIGNLSKLASTDLKVEYVFNPLSDKTTLYNMNMTVKAHIVNNYGALKQKIKSIEFNL
jgi:hypothetical protein